MTISIIIPPPETYHAPPKNPRITKPLKAVDTTSSDLDWEDCAAEEDWENAILGLARSGWGKRFTYWRFINQIVSESRQPSRQEIRRATREVMKTLAVVLRSKKVTRYGKRWLGIQVGAAATSRYVNVRPYCG